MSLTSFNVGFSVIDAANLYLLMVIGFGKCTGSQSPTVVIAHS